MADHEAFHPKLIKFASDVGSVVTDAYGTFEVSMIDVESEFDDVGFESDDVERCSPSVFERLGSLCSEKCRFVWLMLSVPFKLLTYKTLLFHATTFIFSVIAVMCVLTLSMGKLLLSLVAAGGVTFRRTELWALQRLLQVDCGLYNFIAPRNERVMVSSPSSTRMQQAEGLYGMYAQLYFGGVKLLATGIPGALAVLMFVWSVQNVVVIAMGNIPEARSLNGHSRSVYVAVVAIYACILLLYVFAFIAQQLTIFFCSQYLLYRA